MSVNIHLFGLFTVQVEKQEIQDSMKGRLGELLAYLILQPNRKHSRLVVASNIWPNANELQGRRYLRKTLWHLHHLPLQYTKLKTLIQVDRDTLQFATSSKTYVDLLQFERTATSVKAVNALDLSPEQLNMLQIVTNMYKADLLENWYYDWCILARERCRRTFLAMLHKLVRYYEGYGYYEEGLHTAESLLAHDFAMERVHRAVMRLHYYSNNRTAAIRQYELCQQYLHDELGLQPTERTRNLLQQIKTEQLSNRLSLTEVQDKFSGLSTMDLLRSFKNLENAIGSVHAAVKVDIAKIEHALQSSENRIGGE